MNTEMVDISTLTPDPANIRTHDQRNLDAIKGSLQRFGQQKPIVVDGKGIIVAGNGTYTAAKALGWTKIGVVRTTLVGPEAVAFAIADNRSAELAGWDDDALAKTLEGLQLEDAQLAALTGFTDKEIGDLINQTADVEVVEDQVPENPLTRCQPGDLWILGQTVTCPKCKRRTEV